MKKGLTMLFAVMLALAVIFIGSTSALSDMEIGSRLKIVGDECIIDHSLYVQSEKGFEGQAIEDSMYTTSLGFRGKSNISFNSNLEIYINTNETPENVTSTEISYISCGSLTHIKRAVYAKNYEVGAASSVKTVGFSDNWLGIDMTPDNNYLEFSGVVDGKARISHIVVDPTTNIRVVKEVMEATGVFKIDYEAWTENRIDVGTGEDWLECP